MCAKSSGDHEYVDDGDDTHKGGRVEDASDGADHVELFKHRQALLHFETGPKVLDALDERGQVDAQRERAERETEKGELDRPGG